MWKQYCRVKHHTCSTQIWGAQSVIQVNQQEWSGILYMGSNTVCPPSGKSASINMFLDVWWNILWTSQQEPVRSYFTTCFSASWRKIISTTWLIPHNCWSSALWLNHFILLIPSKKRATWLYQKWCTAQSWSPYLIYRWYFSQSLILSVNISIHFTSHQHVAESCGRGGSTCRGSVRLMKHIWLSLTWIDLPWHLDAIWASKHMLVNTLG